MTQKEYNPDNIKCVMCDGSRSTFIMMRRCVGNLMPICLKHLEEMAPLFTMQDLEAYKRSTIKRFINSSWILRILHRIGLIKDTIG